ncbi:hypothetical protein KI387_002737, partial [Taxus chinensis]
KVRMAAIKLHGYPQSTCTTNVLACIHEKEIDYEFVTVDMLTGAHKQPSFLALNPLGQLPVIQDGDLTLFESRAIIKYLAKKNEGKGSNLWGSTLTEQTLVEQWSQVESQSYNPAVTAIIVQKVFAPMMGGKTDEGIVQSSVEKLSKVLDVYEERLSKSKFLAGDFFSIADLPHLSYTHYLIKMAGEGHLITSRPHVKAWWETISSRPSWLKVLAFAKF